MPTAANTAGTQPCQGKNERLSYLFLATLDASDIKGEDLRRVYYCCEYTGSFVSKALPVVMASLRLGFVVDAFYAVTRDFDWDYRAQ